ARASSTACRRGRSAARTRPAPSAARSRSGVRTAGLSTDPEPGRLSAIFGCAGLALTPWERGFFREVQPAGFILFARNCRDPERVRRLGAELQDCVAGAALVLIDQEGGRVQRLRPPHWRAAPAAAVFGQLAQAGYAAALEAAEINARLLAG